nr:MAG TPA: hypothetical protein [Caudoviricetes sp.]
MKALTFLATLCFEYLSEWKPVKNGAVAESGNRQVNRTTSFGLFSSWLKMGKRQTANVS